MTCVLAGSPPPARARRPVTGRACFTYISSVVLRDSWAEGEGGGGGVEGAEGKVWV